MTGEIHIGKALTYLRERKGLSVDAMSAALSVPADDFAMLERDELVPKRYFIDHVREVYGVDLYILTWLLYGDVEKLPEGTREPMRKLSEAWRRELGELLPN